MERNLVRLHTWYSRSLLSVSMALSVVLSGCASPSFYVAAGSKEVLPADMKAVAKPAPVQLTFEFQAKGAPNGQATNLLKDQVLEQVKLSGLFASVNAGTTGGGVLNIVINNVALTSTGDASTQGFASGLTMGLVGAAVTDGYICTVSYLPAGSNELIKTTSRHAIHTTLGTAKAPENAVKANSPEEAVRTVVRQVVSNALRDLSYNPAFN